MILKEALDIIQLSKNYKIGPSKIHGNGVISSAKFFKGDIINKSLYNKDGNLTTTEFGAHLNHSYKPNGITRKIGDCYYTFAFRDINPGDEITVDYTVNKNLEQPEDWWN